MMESRWDLTHLGTKYPWLRVDSTTIEEFRSPFQWRARASSSSSSESSNGEDDSDVDDTTDERKEIERRWGITHKTRPNKRSPSARGRRKPTNHHNRQRVASTTAHNHNQDVSTTRKLDRDSGVKLPPARLVADGRSPGSSSVPASTLDTPQHWKRTRKAKAKSIQSLSLRYAHQNCLLCLSLHPNNILKISSADSSQTVQCCGSRLRQAVE